MTKQQAYEMIVQATWLLQLKREEHEAIVKALNVLKPEEKTEENKTK